MKKSIDTYFLKRIFILTKKLCDITNADPYDPDAYNAVLREVNELSAVVNHDHRQNYNNRKAGKVYRAHRRKDIIIPVLIILGLLGLAWLVYSILF